MTVRRARRRCATVALIATCVASAAAAFAADPAAVAPKVAAAPQAPASSAVALLKPARPYWIELTQAQRLALAPLADDWERLDLQTKKKWVEIGNRYPRMKADEQGRTQQRMREWAMLTPDQRRVARDSFVRVRQMNPEQRADLLRKYHELPPEKRQALVAEGQANKVIVVPKPPTAPPPRRVQISEGAKVRNPAVAAQKGTNPLIAPARPAASPATGRPQGPIPASPAGAPAVGPPSPAAAATPAAGSAPLPGAAP